MKIVNSEVKILLAENFGDVSINTTSKILAQYLKLASTDEGDEKTISSEKIERISNFLLLWVLFESVVKETKEGCMNCRIKRFVINIDFDLSDLEDIFSKFYDIYGKDGNFHNPIVVPNAKVTETLTVKTIFNYSDQQFDDMIQKEPKVILTAILFIIKEVRNNLVHNDNRVKFRDKQNPRSSCKRLKVMAVTSPDNQYGQDELFLCASKLLQELLLKNFRNIK